MPGLVCRYLTVAGTSVAAVAGTMGRLPAPMQTASYVLLRPTSPPCAQCCCE